MKRLMTRLVFIALCVMFPSGDTIAQCFGGRCFSTVRVSSFSGGLRGRFQQRRFERDVSNAIRTQNALNSLAFAQSFVVAPQVIQQRFVVPTVVPTSFIVPQVSYVQSAPYVQYAPQPAPQSDIPRVTSQLRQLQEMSQALRALQTE